MKKNNKKLIIAAILLSIFSVSFIISYGFFEYEDKTNELVINTGIINMAITNNTALNLTGEFPMEYDDVLDLENDTDTTNDHLMTFKLTANNQSTESFYYSLQVVEGEDISGKVRLNPEYINFDLYQMVSGEYCYYLRNVKLSDYLNTNLVTGTIAGSKSLNKTFFLRVWINEDLVVGNTSDSVISMEDFAKSYANVFIKVDCDNKEKETNFSYINKASKRNTTTSIYSSTLNKSDILGYYKLNSKNIYFLRGSMGNDEGNSDVTYFFANYKFFKDKLLNTTTINFKQVSSSVIDNYVNNKIKANDLAPKYTDTNGTKNDSDTSDTADYYDHTDYNYNGHKTIGYFNQIGVDADSNPIYEYNIVSDGLIIFPEDASNMFNLTVNVFPTWSTTERDFTYWGYYYNDETDTSRAISYFQNIEYINFDNVYTGNTTDFGYMFHDLEKLKEIDLTKLDTHNGVRMPGIFCWCKSLTELDVNNLDLSRATDISWLFAGLNLDISEDGTIDDFKGGLQNLDVHRVTTISDVFTKCPNIARLDLSSWHTGPLEFFGVIYPYGNSTLDGYNRIYGTDYNDNIKLVYLIGPIMGQASDFSTLKYLDISNFDVSNLTSLFCTFMNYTALETLKIDNWDTSNVKNFGFMFLNCSSLVNFDTSSLSISSNATNISGMFKECSNLKNIDTSTWNTSNVIYMSAVFRGCTLLTNVDVSGFNTNNVVNMDYMFMDCKNLKELNLNNFDFSNVKETYHMFNSCSNLETVTGVFNFSSALTYLDCMFNNCPKLTSIPAFISDSTESLPKVSSLYNLFYNCSSLTELNLTSLVNSNVTSFTKTFYGCSSLTTIYVNSNYADANVTTSDSVFYLCNLLEGQNGTKVSVAKIYNTTYAKIDTAEVLDTDGVTVLQAAVPGYFSVKA